MKLIGILILLAMSVMTGCFAAQSLKDRLDRLRCIRRMTEQMRLMIRYEALETQDMIHRLSEDKGLIKLNFISVLSGIISDEYDIRPFSEQWDEAVREQVGINDEDRELLYRIGAFLGTCDIEGQSSSLELASAEADRLTEEAAGQYAAKGRLYRSLGAVAGALLAVIAV